MLYLVAFREFTAAGESFPAVKKRRNNSGSYVVRKGTPQ